MFAVISSVLVGQGDSALLMDVSGSRKCPALFQDLAACSTHMPRSRGVTATERLRIHFRGKYEKSSLCVPCGVIFHCSKMGTISVPSSGSLDEAVPSSWLFPTMFCSKQQKARASALPVPTLTVVWEESGVCVFLWWGKVCHGVASFKLAGASETPAGGQHCVRS